MFFKHPLSVVETDDIGDGTQVSAFARILSGAHIGRDCRICDHTLIESDVIIGDRVTLQCGVRLWDGITIEDDVFIGTNATFTNDCFPPGRLHPPADNRRTLIRAGASVGANATVLAGVNIGPRAIVGAATLVTQNVPADSIVVGNPGKIVGYVDAKEHLYPPPTRTAESTGVSPTGVKGVTLHRLPKVNDLRGDLSFGETQRHVPFDVKRYFLVFGVASENIRGEHAHRKQHQFLICVHGSCHLVADDGQSREEFTLNDPSIGLHLPPLVWGVQYKYTSDAVLLVLTSDYYDPADYIRDYGEFRRIVGCQ